ncbi:Hypothetical protein CINCED_3A014822 [Cinara cedri]|uniref:Ubiquitin carboxyl-terminal hydrolase n=1 Tax=Cinara cedri TaxID=506608 RepID=A0A5E4M5F7_9HEMI|nr:Hypothetical protein CINCED_3A014822 [Cinara cedri]
MRNKKDIHIASSMDELETHIKLPDKMKDLNLLILNEKAEQVFNKAKNNYEDEEKTYILLMKYCEIVQLMKKQFNRDASYIAGMNKFHLRTAITMLTHIKESLENRYEEKAKQANNKEQIKYSKPKVNGVRPNEEKNNFEFESTISNKDLFFLLQNTKRSKICLLDTRPSDAFQDSKITACDVINIPKENLVPGLTADLLKNKLEGSFQEKWIKRHSYDYIVILDQGTEDIEGDLKLIYLRNALLQWDPPYDNRKKVKFLRGGYEDFSYVCPWETSQSAGLTQPNSDAEHLSDVELEPEPESVKPESKRVQYPSLDSMQNDLLKFQIKPTDSSSEEEMDTQEITSTLIEPPVFDRSTKPSIKMNQFNKVEIIKPLYNINDELDEENNEEKDFCPIPHVDRSTKPLDDLLKVSKTQITGGDGLRGLLNLGNTCYMNSILQCLSSTEDLVKYFINVYNEFINHESRTKGLVARELSNVIKNLWTTSDRSFLCHKFKETIGEFKDMFKHYDQQDSHEFLTILLDWLHDDLNEPVDNRIILGASKETGEEDWGHWTKTNNSIIQQLFYGQQKSTVSCDTCFEKSITFEPFSSLSLPLPSEGNRCTLADCLQLYLNGESICGWHCPKCKCSRDATKKLDIMRLPPYLIIHLKRFSSTGYKKNSNVEFPKTDLNMSNFINGIEHRNWKYSLYGVSNHSGSLDGGHYTAYCLKKLKNKWYKFDDVRVYEVDSSIICSSEAYILFYCRKNLLMFEN